MPPKKRQRKQQGQAARGTKTRSSETQQAATVTLQETPAPEPEFIQLASDSNGQAGNGNLTGGVSGSNVLSTSTNTLGVQGMSGEILRNNANQSEFQLPDVRCADDDLAMHVPHDICINIWKNEYINLAALLKKNQKQRGDETGNLYINEHGLIQTRPKALREITNIRE